MGYSRITAVLTLVAMTGVSSLASAKLSWHQEEQCEAFASLHYALASEASVDADGAYEDAYAGCAAGWESYNAASLEARACTLLVSGVEREGGSGYGGYEWGSSARWVSFCQDDGRE